MDQLLLQEMESDQDAAWAGRGRREGRGKVQEEQEGEDVEEVRCAVMGVFAPITGIVGAIQAAEAAGFTVIVVDSLSHAWMGKGGALAVGAAVYDVGRMLQAW